MPSDRTKFYLDKQNAKIKGVCAGIADYTGIDTAWIRIGTVLLTFMTGGPWIPIAYVVAAMVTDKKPLHMYEDAENQKFWQGVRQSPARTTRELKSHFREIDNRLADLEIYYTSSNKQLADEIDSLR